MKYNQIRRSAKEIKIGRVAVGGENPIAIQSMTNTDTADKVATVAQIRKLAEGGCDIVRITVPDLDAAETVRAIKNTGIEIPVVADIHFDYRVALRVAEYGVDKIRINPGNIGDEQRIQEVCMACNKRNIPIRIGVNSGSLEKNILAKYGSPTAEALCESALYHVRLLEKNDFDNIVVSIKSSDVHTMIAANRMLASEIPYPIHLGVTEAGSYKSGLVKSAIGIGSLLSDGIGDTIRVSLTDDPTLEVASAKEILNSLCLEGQRQMNIISCPTCGRTKINLISLVKHFEHAVDAEGLRDIPIEVALMGCAVNGPGEAREADIGVAGGKGEALLFSHGRILYKIPEDKIIETLIAEIKKFKDK